MIDHEVNAEGSRTESVLRPQVLAQPFDVDGTNDAALPTWFIAGLAAAVAWCSTAVIVGVVSLVLDLYAPAIVIGSASLVALGAIALMRRRGADAGAVTHRWAIAAVLIAVCFFAAAAAFHSEHVLTDRDPAVYVNDGRMIARSHQLNPRVDPTFHDPRFTFAAAGFGTHGDRLFANFFPGLPVLLAVGWSIGGDTGLLVMPAALAALGVLICYAFAAHLVGPRWALIAPLLLTLAPLQLWFGRDAYSELAVQVVVLGGLWLFLEARDRNSFLAAALAGATVASSTMVRIDALAIVACVFALLGIEWARASARRSSSLPTATDMRPVVAAFAAAFTATAIAGIWATNRTNRGYIRSLWSDYHTLLVGIAVGVVGALAVAFVHWVRPGIGHRLAGVRPLAIAGGLTAVGLALWAYVARPERGPIPPLVPGAKLTHELRHVRNLWHWSRSLHWFSSYLGVVALCLALVGFLVLGWMALRGSGPATMISIVVVPFAVFYLARPSITPDQPWAMRRYLAIVVPGIAIAIATAFVALWRATRRSSSQGARIAGGVIAVAVAALVVIPSVQALKPFARARAQHGALSAVHTICDHAGTDGAVLVYGHQYLDIELPQTIRGFCGVPAARPSPRPGVAAVDLADLARTTKARGKRLLVVTATPDQVRRAVPGATLLEHRRIDDAYSPERVLDHRPRHFEPRPRDIWLFEIPPGSPSAPAQ